MKLTSGYALKLVLQLKISSKNKWVALKIFINYRHILMCREMNHARQKGKKWS